MSLNRIHITELPKTKTVYWIGYLQTHKNSKIAQETCMQDPPSSPSSRKKEKRGKKKKKHDFITEIHCMEMDTRPASPALEKIKRRNTKKEKEERERER